MRVLTVHEVLNTGLGYPVGPGTRKVLEMKRLTGVISQSFAQCRLLGCDNCTREIQKEMRRYYGLA